MLIIKKKINREQQEVAHLWNCHRISPSRNAVSPSGRPLMMYGLPHLFGTTDHIKAVLHQQILTCREESLPRGPYTCDETVFQTVAQQCQKIIYTHLLIQRRQSNCTCFYEHTSTPRFKSIMHGIPINQHKINTSVSKFKII